MKKSLYIRIQNKGLGLLFILMPYFFWATAIANPSSHQAEYGSVNPADTTVSRISSAVSIHKPNTITSYTYLNSFVGTSQYTINNVLNRKLKPNFSAINAMAAPPTISCPGNILKNTDPNQCKAMVSGLAAIIADTDNDITTLTWIMSGATIAASPISGINNLASYTFNKGITSVTYRVTDANGSAISCSYTVAVTDIQKPIIVCPDNETLLIASCATITGPVTFNLLSVSDNCGISSFSSNPPLPAQLPLGNTSVTWTATDNSGNSSQCVQIVTVANELPMNLAMSSTPISCFGGSDGSATVAITNGRAPYTYSWNTVPVQSTSTVTNLLPGTYTVTATDFDGCSATASVTVSQPAAGLSLSLVTKSNLNCFGIPTGSITVAGNGGTPAYQYSINGVLFQASGIFSNLAAGTYTLTVKDSRNCTDSTSVTITQPATAVAGTAIKTDVICRNTATGSITVTGNGGTPPYQYNVNGGVFQASSTFNNLIAGTYNIIIKDANNCPFGLAVTITQSATALSASISSHTNVLCAGQANGSATVTASGGTAPYTYSWNTVPVQTTATATSLTARAYTVTVTDAAGCKATASITITQPTPLVISITKTNVACFGDSTGTATASAIGGKPPYTYAWITNPIQITATATNLPAGTYTVAVFDSLGCFKPGFVTITQPATKLIASVTGVINVDCAGNNTGSITVTGSGGVAPIQYSLNGGLYQAGGTFSNLAGGTYTIIARDANNCTVNLAATITAPTALNASITSQSNVNCNGQNTGNATVTVSGGTAPYTYSWNTVPVQTTATATSLTARAYTVTVTDVAGCKVTASITITQPAPLVVSITKTNVACFGDSTGTATATASGGKPPYTFAWITNPIQTTATATNLPAGTYTVAVFDSLGCFKPGFVTITQPAAKLIASVTGVINVDCAGSNTGSITVTGSGGVAPIQYSLNGGVFQASGIFSNLAGGTYAIIARDANNCTVNLSATITAPAALNATITSLTNVNCNGQNTGNATVTASGGTTPYSYSWNTVPVQTTATATSLTARAYVVSVIDAAGCTDTASVTIIQSTPIIVTITSTNVDCFGNSTGSATVLTSGGKPPYSYAWTTVPAQTTSIASNLPAGTYTVAVFDSLGCFKPGFITISQPAAKLTASISHVDVVCAGNTGSLTAVGSGGTTPYLYNINGGAFQESGVFNNLSAGVYNVITQDANNCTFNISATITEPANALKASVSNTNVLCFGKANGSATVSAVNGTMPYSYSWNTIPVQTTATISNLAVGIYIVTTKDNAGCIVMDTAFITEPLELTVSITNQINYDCASATNGSVTVTGVGGTPNYQYSLNGGSYMVSGTFTNMPVGNYIVTVRDTNNCEAFIPVDIIVGGLILAVNDDVTTSEDIPVSGNVMANDQVVCNLPITVIANTTPAHGSVIVNADGSFTYTPSLNYNGLDFFDYTIKDNLGGISTASQFIIIEPVNDPPVTLNDSVSVNYNLSTSGNILLNGHYDPDGTALTVAATPILNAGNGIFVIASDGSYTYTPDLNYIGNDMVIISVCDAGIPLPPACSSDTIFIVVLPPNEPPITVNENIFVCQEGNFIGTTSNGGTVFNGETDPENNLPITLNSIPVEGPAHGTFSITDPVTGTFNYSPSVGYAGSDYVVLSICDSGIPVKCSNDTIFIEVVSSITADAGISQKLCNSDVAVLVGNSATSGIGSWTFVSGPNVPLISPATGNVAIASGLIASVTPYIFNYAINNGSCSTADTMSVINYAPATPSFAGNDQTFCNGTGNLTITLSGNTPVNGTGFWSQLAGPAPATIQDATDPNTNVADLTAGIYAFEWQISNGICSPNADVVNITVSQSAAVDAGNELSTCESAPVPISGSSALNYVSILWTSSGDGFFSDPTLLKPIYTPGPLDISTGTAKLILNAVGFAPCADGSDFALLTINKNPLVNAGPDDVSCVGSNKTISLATASDYSNLQWSVTPVSAGTLINSETLNPTFTPATGFAGTATLTLSAQGYGSCMTSEVADTMHIVVNTSVVADAGAGQTIPPGTAAILTGTVSGGSGFYAWSWQPSDLLVNPLSDKTATVALNSTTTFTLTVLDITTGCTDDATVEISINIEGNIDAAADYDTTLVNTSGTINVLANDLNPDNEVLTVSICGYPSHGMVVLNSDNTITYTPYSDYQGDDEFCYKICSASQPLVCSDNKVFINIKHPGLEDLFVYNGVSPNHDGINDVWKIKGIEKYPDNSVIIFNRWGDKLREFANYNNTTHSWDGKNEHGDPLPDGTYFYILDVKNVGVLKGWIYLRGK